MSEEQSALPPSERSTFGPLAGCAVVALLLAVAAGGTWLLLQRKAPPVLSQLGSGATLSYEDLGSAELILGPGCSALRFAQTEDMDSLVWTYQGREVEVTVSRSDKYLFVGHEIVKPNQTVILLPNGMCRIVDPTAKPLLKLERWEGPLGQHGRCEIWLYKHGDWKDPSFRDYLVYDGRDLGRPSSTSRSLGSEGWSFTERFANASREGNFDTEKKHVTYELVVGGQAEEATLEQTYQGEWSAGDPLPQPAGF